MKKRERGFTLIELLVVVIILGVLASLAIPAYMKVSEKGKLTEGVHALAALRTAQLAYYATDGSFNPTFANLELSLDLDHLKHFSTPIIAAQSAANGTIEMITTRQAPLSGRYGGYTIHINEHGGIWLTGAGSNVAELGYTASNPSN